MQTNSIPKPEPLADQAAALGATIVDSATKIRGEAAELMDATRRTAATGLRNAATAVRERAGQLPGVEAMSDAAACASSTWDSTADYVRKSDGRKMSADMATIVKRNPGPFLIAAVAVGFLAGLAWRGERE